MFDRIWPGAIFRAHWKSLSDYRDDQKRSPDIIARGVVILLPLGAGIGTYLAGGALRAPDAILAGVSLLAGGFLAAFTYLSSMRVRLTDRRAVWGDADRLERDAMDETSAHLLAASYVSAVAAAALIVAMNTTSDETGAVTGAWAAAIVALLIYILVVFLITLPRLYTSYVAMHEVRKSLSGLHRD